MRKFLLLLFASVCFTVHAVDLKHCHIVVSNQDAALVKKIAAVLSEDIERVAGVRPEVNVNLNLNDNLNLNPNANLNDKAQYPTIILASANHAYLSCRYCHTVPSLADGCRTSSRWSPCW